MTCEVYTGLVRHKRFLPKPHGFSTRTFYVYLNLDEIGNFFKKSLFWSVEKNNLASFRRQDYLPHVEGKTLKTAVQNLIKEKHAVDFVGEVYLLAHMRYFGYCMNPLAIYYCFAEGKLAFAINEIHNTPWGERFTYVFDLRNDVGPTYRKTFRKEFHVSPFLPMDLVYNWDFKLPGKSITVAISDYDHDSRVFEAQLNLKKTKKSLDRLILEYPFHTFRVIFGIYSHALRLWLKGIAFISHPAKR